MCEIQDTTQSAGVFRGFDGIYIVDIDESMDYQQKKAQINVNNPSITYDYLDLGFNLIDYLDYYLDAWDYGTPRNIDKKSVDHDAENVVVKADKSVLDKALTIKYDEQFRRINSHNNRMIFGKKFQNHYDC